MNRNIFRNARGKKDCGLIYFLLTLEVVKLGSSGLIGTSPSPIILESMKTLQMKKN